MASPRKSQKQLTDKYKDNLDHYNRKQWWRRAVIWTSVLAVLASVAAIRLFYNRGREKFFNPGEISRHHAAFGNDCEKCHDKFAISTGQLTVVKVRQTVNDRFRPGIAFEPIDRK